jgi:hypothetical protein
MGEIMADIKDIIKNVEQIYGSNNSLNLLKDFERVIDELDVYVYDNWIDGELVEGPKETRYFVQCTFMWHEDQMPEPKGGKRLLDYGCKVEFAKDTFSKVRKIKKPDDIRPGTRKGKIDVVDVWKVRITMPKKLMNDINRGYRNLDKNKVEDILSMNGGVNANVEPVDTQQLAAGGATDVAAQPAA